MDGGIEVILGELIEMVQATAPMLWAIAQRQVVAQRVSYVMWAVMFFLVAVALGILACHSARIWARDKRTGKSRRYDRDDWTPQNTAWFTGAVAVIISIAALFLLHAIVMYTISPDYYAIKVLLGLVR